MLSVAFVGAGPTTLYTLSALLRQPLADARITVFETQATAGVGSPYRPGWNDAAMLANIASAEIPPIVEPLLDWLMSQTDEALEAIGVTPGELNDRTFVPRVVLGCYFQSQFERLVDTARKAGVAIDVRCGCRVDDAVNQVQGIDLIWHDEASRTFTEQFDHVVLATGHQWPSRQQVRRGYFASPWPAATLARVVATRVGVRGTSLTAIDAAVALAQAHGAFVRRATGDLDYEPAPGTEGLQISLMSRKGLLPEADFYFPLPHAPLTICTPEAVRRLIAAGPDDLLDQTFDLFRREMVAVDPDYAARLGLERGTLEAFGEAYFSERSRTDPFVWAQANLIEARASHADRTTAPWRDAMLRMHEVVAAIVPCLDGAQFDRFSRHLKPVFVDAYGAVPHTSVERLLALHRAGRLEVLALGDSYVIDTRLPEGGARLVHDGHSRWFPVFIEATGQRVLGAIQFPFLSLIQQGIVRDAASDDGARGIKIDDRFSIVAEGLPLDRLFCLSLPFIMGRHPFVQGITSSHAMGQIVGRRLASLIAAHSASIDSLRAVA